MAWPFKANASGSGEGKPPEADQSKAEMEAFVSTMKTSFEEIIKPLRDDLAAQKTEIEALKTVHITPPKPVTPTDPPDPTLEPERWKAETLGPLALQAAQLRAEITEDRGLRDIPQEWRDVVEPRIKELLKSTPIERKVMQDYGVYIQNCVNLVIGEEARKAGLRRDPSNKRFFIEDAAGSSNGTTDVLGSELGWTDSKGRYHSPAETLSKLDIDPKEFVKGA
jgi:hypothetical protein